MAMILKTSAVGGRYWSRFSTGKKESPRVGFSEIQFLLIPKKELQGFPSAAAQIGKKVPVIEEVPAKDRGDAEDEMSVGNLLEHLGTEPFPEFHHPLLMAGGTEMTALAGEGQKIFMVTIPALYPGKAMVSPLMGTLRAHHHCQTKKHPL